jgi:hypothetical protein
MQQNEHGLYIMADDEVVRISTKFGIITIVNDGQETRVCAQGYSKEVDYGGYKATVAAVDATDDTLEDDRLAVIRRIKMVPKAEDV